MRTGRRAVGAIVGLLGVGVAVGAGEAAAAFVRPEAAPVVAVGNRLIVLTPEPVKQWAIRSFGTGDKQVLLIGIYAVLALAGMGIGVLATRRIDSGLAAIGVFGIAGGYCALTAPAARGTDVVPTIVAVLAGAAALVALVRATAAWDAPAGGNAASAEDVTAGRDAAARSAPAPAGPDRRRFLLTAAAAAGGAAILGFGGRAAQHARFAVDAVRRKLTLPAPVEPAAAITGARDPDLGRSPVPWQTPNDRFYRIDTALSPPQLDPQQWTLRIHGMVDRPLTLTYSQLLARPMVERWITLCCVSNEVGGGLISNAKFLGARLADLLREAGLQPGADQLLMSSQDGMTIGAPAAVVMDGRDSLLAVGMNGEPLPVAHGFPVRAVVPGLYGYVSACKWIVDINATTFAAHRAYWVLGGWDPHPPIELESRIDTPRPGQVLPVGRPAAVAGVAWDQHVGVSAVEVQVDDGEWLPARLAPVPSTDTWRQWLVAWTPPRAGSYTLRVRATDAAGTVQTARVRGPGPAGATGWHTITVRAR